MTILANILRDLALSVAVLNGDATATHLLQPEQFHCVATTVFGEARGEGERGMAMVVQSIANRHEILGHSGCRIAQRAYDGYRLWKARDPNRADPESWFRAQRVTLKVLMGDMDLGDCTDVTHFLNPDAVRRMPNWASADNRICQVGNHIAYRIENI